MDQHRLAPCNNINTRVYIYMHLEDKAKGGTQFVKLDERDVR